MCLRDQRISASYHTFQLATTLSEVKYLLLLAGTNIPDEVLRLYESRERLRNYKLCLDDVVAKYAHLRTKLSSSEGALIATSIMEMDCLLVKGTTDLIWSDEGKLSEPNMNLTV